MTLLFNNASASKTFSDDLVSGGGATTLIEDLQVRDHESVLIRFEEGLSG